MNLIGREYNGYKFIDTLGSGSFGSVYKVVKYGKIYAAKILSETYVLEEFKNESNRITREIEVLKRATSEMLIRYIDDFYIENDFGNKEYVIVMEYFNGITLRELIRKGINDKEIMLIFKQILTGVKALHNTIIEKNGIIHRDLKPENILINENLQVKIIDYGLSKIIDFSTITSTGKAVGSPLYMSPEQILDSKNIDKRSDIYSLGIILYEMITGNVPYKASTIPELIIEILNNPIIPLTQYRKSIGSNIQTAIYRATSKKPYERFRNIEEFEKFISKEEIIENKIFRGKYYPWLYKEKTVAETFKQDNKLEVIYPIHVKNWMKSINKMVESKAIEAIVDPSTQRLSYATFANVNGLLELPYKPEEGVITLDYLKDFKKREDYIKNWYSYVKMHNKIILPYHYISNTDYSIENVDEWIKINIQLANEALQIVETTKEKYIMISINLNHLVLQKEKLLSYYSTLNPDGYIVQVSDMKQLNEQTISAYINFMKKLQDNTNKPVIALKVPVPVGLGLIAKGIHGFSTGIASIEYFDEQYIKEETDPFNMYAKYYFPELLSFYTYPRKDVYAFSPVYEYFGKCNCKYCNNKEWINIVSGDINIQLHFLEQMKIEVEKLNSFVDENEKLEYYKERLRKAIEGYTNIPKEISRDRTNNSTFKIIKCLLKVL